MAWNGNGARSCRLPIDEPCRIAGFIAIQGIEFVPTRSGSFSRIQNSKGILQTRNPSGRGIQVPVEKMVSFAIEGVTSFSTKPLTMITGLGLFSVFVGIVMLIYTFISVFSGHAVAGWGSMMCSLWILGGFILLALGIIGEYIAKIYLEVKARPRYIVETTL